MLVIHVPYHFDVNSLGGTEIYVYSLIKELQKLGVDSQIAAPSNQQQKCRFNYDEIVINYFGIDSKNRIEYAYGFPDLEATKNFGVLVNKLMPDIVHFHASTSAVNSEMVKLCKKLGIKVFFTYHTPTVSCPRGTMLYLGKEPCDGKIELNRCARCMLIKHGVNDKISQLIRLYPLAISERIFKKFGKSKMGVMLGLKYLVHQKQREATQMLTTVDHLIAVCNWVYDVILINGLPSAKISLIRQGLPFVYSTKGKEKQKGHILIKYFGRLDETKGVLELIRAFKAVRLSNLKLEIYGVIQNKGSQYFSQIKDSIIDDSRITLMKPVAAREVQKEMSEADLIAVPSMWMETGPLVVLEAFSVSVPVIGSKLGGISELVSDNVDGILVEKNTEHDWKIAFEKISSESIIRQLKSNIKPVRTASQLAKETKMLYEEK